MIEALLWHLADIALGLPSGSPENLVIGDIQEVLIRLVEQSITQKQAETDLRCIIPAYKRRKEGEQVA